MRSLSVVFVDVGEGDTTLITLPNGKTVLVDCFLADRRTRDYVVSKLRKEQANGIPILDCLVITHPHRDHIGGIGRLAEEVRVDEVWESGHRLYIPKEQQEEYPDYYDMLELFRQVKARGGIVKTLRADRRGFIGGLDDSVRWYCLSPSRSYAEEDRPSEEQIHEECLVLKLEFAGQSVLFTGDTTWKSWSDHIMPHYGELVGATVLHASHHGSRTFFMDSEDSEVYAEHVVAIGPDITIIPVGPNSHGHPHQEALGLYGKYTFRRSATQVMRTDQIGTIFMKLFKDGHYTVVPRHHVRSRHGRFLGCYAEVIPDPPPDDSGTYPRQVWITFNLRVKGPAGIQVDRIRWEVQNNGVGPDSRVHDWYVGQEGHAHSYSNHTAFNGTHNLYVRVSSKRGRTLAEFIHTVRVRDEN